MTMEYINRVLASLLGAVLLAVGTGVALGTLLISGPYVVTFSTGEQWNLSHLTRADQIFAAVIGIPVALVGLTICVSEAIGPPRRSHIVIQENDGHRVEVAVVEIEGCVKAALEQLPAVHTATVHLSSSKERVRVRQVLVMIPQAPVRFVTADVRHTVDIVLTRQFGLVPGEIQTDIRFGETTDAAPWSQPDNDAPYPTSGMESPPAADIPSVSRIGDG